MERWSLLEKTEHIRGPLVSGPGAATPFAPLRAGPAQQQQLDTAGASSRCTNQCLGVALLGEERNRSVEMVSRER
jgi:hypothetical protein